MCLSGAFSDGAQDVFDKLAKIKLPDPLSLGSLSHLAARQRWVDGWMHIVQRNVFNVVAKSIASRIRICHVGCPEHASTSIGCNDTGGGHGSGNPQLTSLIVTPFTCNLATIPNHKGQILQDRNREPKTTSRRCLINNRDKRSVGTEYREDNAS